MNASLLIDGDNGITIMEPLGIAVMSRAGRRCSNFFARRNYCYIVNVYFLCNEMSLKLRRKLSESGRSLVLRIPRDVERVLSMRGGDEVDLWVEDGRVIIEPVRRR